MADPESVDVSNDEAGSARVRLRVEAKDSPMVLADLHRALKVDDPLLCDLIGSSDDGALLDLVEGAGFVIESNGNRESSGSADTTATGVRLRLRRQLTLPDTVGPAMTILVCGLNPSIYSAEVGVGFGRPGNRFWPAALAAGIVSRDRDPRHALMHHCVGMTDLVKRATRKAAELDAHEYRTGLARVERLAEWLQPRTICFVGLSGWRSVVDRKATAGWQEMSLGGRPVYLMPSTSGLNASSQLPDLTQHLRLAAQTNRS